MWMRRTRCLTPEQVAEQDRLRAIEEENAFREKEEAYNESIRQKELELQRRLRRRARLSKRGCNHTRREEKVDWHVRRKKLVSRPSKMKKRQRGSGSRRKRSVWKPRRRRERDGARAGGSEKEGNC